MRDGNFDWEYVHKRTVEVYSIEPEFDKLMER